MFGIWQAVSEQRVSWICSDTHTKCRARHENTRTHFMAIPKKNKQERLTEYMLVYVLKCGKVSEWPDRFIENTVVLVLTLDACRKDNPLETYMNAPCSCFPVAGRFCNCHLIFRFFKCMSLK